MKGETGPAWTAQLGWLVLFRKQFFCTLTKAGGEDGWVLVFLGSLFLCSSHSIEEICFSFVPYHPLSKARRSCLGDAFVPQRIDFKWK